MNFVTGNLRPVKSEADPDLSGWYKRNSLVFVAADHACWTDEGLVQKVSKKRFGRVRRSPQAGLGRMLDEHAQEVRHFITERLTPDADADPETEEEAEKPPPQQQKLRLGHASGDTTEEDK